MKMLADRHTATDFNLRAGNNGTTRTNAFTTFRLEFYWQFVIADVAISILPCVFRTATLTVDEGYARQTSVKVLTPV